MATWIAPKTFEDGHYLTATELNAFVGPLSDLQVLKDMLHSIGIDADSGSQTISSAFSGLRVHGSSQEIEDDVWTPIVWSSVRWARHDSADWSPLVSEYPHFVHLPAKPGHRHSAYYAMGAHVAFAGNTTGVRGVRLRMMQNETSLSGNGTIMASKVEEAVAAGTEHALSLWTCPTNDQFGADNWIVEVYQNSGDKLSLVQAPAFSPEFWAVALGAGFTLT